VISLANPKRDFTSYVLKTAGKAELIGCPGHEFFTKVMKAKLSDRGRVATAYSADVYAL
jgi:hypothetical protein